MRGELPRDQTAGIVRHLLTRCPECSVVTRLLWRFGEWPPSVRAGRAALAARVRHRRRSDKPDLI
jgi:hypothetical protein